MSSALDLFVFFVSFVVKPLCASARGTLFLSPVQGILVFTLCVQETMFRNRYPLLSASCLSFGRRQAPACLCVFARRQAPAGKTIREHFTSVYSVSLILLSVVFVFFPCFSLIADILPSPEASWGSLFPTVPVTIKGTCSWKDDTLSSTVDVRMGGTIAKGRTLTLGGKLNIGVNEGLSLQSGWVKYSELDWSVSVGKIAFPGTVSTDTMSIEFDYTPQGSPYSAKYHHEANKSSLDFNWKWSTLSFGIKLSNSDFTVSSSINTNAVKMEVKIEESGFTLAFTPHSSGDFSLSAKLVSNSGETTISFSPVCGPFSGKLSFSVAESARKTEIAPQFTTSLAGGWKLKANLEFKRALGENLHTFDSKGSLCLSYNGSSVSGSLTTTFTGSSDLLTAAESNKLTVQGKSTFRFDPGWTIALDTTVSQQLGTTDQPTSLVKVEFSVPLHSDSWSAGFKLGLQAGQEGTASFSVSAGDMSIDVSASRSSFNLSLGTQFDTLLPLIKTKGRIVGLVFVDENQNGKPDPGEEGPSGLVIESDGEQAVTGSDGRFRFYPQPAGIYELKIINLPDEYRVEPHAVSFELRAGETKRVQIRLVRSVSTGG